MYFFVRVYNREYFKFLNYSNSEEIYLGLFFYNLCTNLIFWRILCWKKKWNWIFVISDFFFGTLFVFFRPWKMYHEIDAPHALLDDTILGRSHETKRLSWRKKSFLIIIFSSFFPMWFLVMKNYCIYGIIPGKKNINFDMTIDYFS